MWIWTSVHNQNKFIFGYMITSLRTLRCAPGLRLVYKACNKMFYMSYLQKVLFVTISVFHGTIFHCFIYITSLSLPKVEKYFLLIALLKFFFWIIFYTNSERQYFEYFWFFYIYVLKFKRRWNELILIFFENQLAIENC